MRKANILVAISFFCGAIVSSMLGGGHIENSGNQDNAPSAPTGAAATSGEDDSHIQLTQDNA